MKRFIGFFMLIFVQSVVCAQEYFPEGTKWTEVRLDTLKYDSWYTESGDEWLPNYETVEYQVRGEYTDEYGEKYKCVYTNGPQWTDSLAFLLKEESSCVHVAAIIYDDYREKNYVSISIPAYQFEWSVGQGLYYEDFMSEATPTIPSLRFFYGIIDEIKENDLGGIRAQRYVDLDGSAPEDEANSSIKNVATRECRIIQGIGLTEWNAGECLFGAQHLYDFKAMHHSMEQTTERHYRSVLVSFERGGELLYSQWPRAGVDNGIMTINNACTPASSASYDLLGRPIGNRRSPMVNGTLKIRKDTKTIVK